MCLPGSLKTVLAVEAFQKTSWLWRVKFPYKLYLRKSIYIIKRIIIFIGEQLGKKEVETLYKDAIILHLLREGYSEHRAEAEARRRMMRDDVL